MYKELRNICKSIRLSDTTYNYVIKAEGKSFNDKYENLILYSMAREEELKNLEKEYLQRIEKLKGELNKIEEISDFMNMLQDYMLKAINKAEEINL